MSAGGRVASLGILVPDLDQAVRVFADFGYLAGARSEPSVGADGRVLRSVRLSLANGPDLVVEQLDDAAGRPLLPHWGLASHPCWYVDDMEAAVAGLREVGMAAENAIVDRFAHERGEQSTYIHFDSPWGMDLELISNPLPVAYELEGAPLVTWHPARPATWVDGAGGEPAPAPPAAIATNRGTVHMGMRVPDLDQAVEFFNAHLGCETVFLLPRLQRSGGRWTEIPATGEPPEPDRGVPDERLPHGTTIRVGFVRCANFNFEPMELLIPDEEGVRRPAFDREAAQVMHPDFRVDSVVAAAAALEAAGCERDETLPGVARWSTPWGQPFGLTE